ncbi:sigma-70 family RNA polymerase sigma factor [soil metagenome]
MDDVALADTHLVTRAKAGRVDAFEELVRRHRLRVYRVALRMLGDPGDAEDATQDAFVQAWRGMSRFRADSAFSTWMYRIVTNRCLNVLRARRPDNPLPEDQRSTGEGPAEVVEAATRIDDLKRAIERLTPEQRAPVVLRELEGCSYEQLAEALDITVPAVKSRLHRARMELVSAMRQWR